MTIFEEFLVQLEMQSYWHEKLTLKNILNIKKENIKEIESQKIQDIPWHFLMKLVALDSSARRTRYKDSNHGSSADNIEDRELNDYFDIHYEGANTSYLHPLDVVCALLHCSDHFLKQEIVSRMSMCQFAVPLLLPAYDGTCCTLMLWAMRDIVKRWRPHSLAESKGFMEDNVVNVPMPTFSFVRLGKTKLSKSKILNQVLNTAQQKHDFFIHDNMEGGNIERLITNGLVEMSWYFPSGRKQSDIFPEPIAVTNLRGDLESNWNQFSFLTRVSSAVFIFIESIRERDVTLLSNRNDSNTKYYFIITPSPGKDTETLRHLRYLMSVLNIERNNIIMKKGDENETALVRKVQSSICYYLSNSHKRIKVTEMDKHSSEHNISVDEHIAECVKAREHAEEITKEIKDVAQYKKETMILQGGMWKEISKIQNEMCRLKNQGTKNAQDYQSELKEKHSSLYKTHVIPKGIKRFISSIYQLSDPEKKYFFKWMKFNLDLIARNNLSVLQAEYKEKSNKPQNNPEYLLCLGQKISDSSLGIEHFLREIGCIYENEYFLEGKKQQSLVNNLPGMAASLLLHGFPLELIDGDAFNIPLKWMQDVLTELDTKTGGQCRMRVITVLGVQSTGKSTLLNTMLGLQFPVASGRCTRGAFMTLIRVEEDVIEELGCDFILVIDTEGLKAPELASLEDSYEHDNKLATLVIGLSDITIINMAMENTSEMKDTLQIVVHAFLRMNEIGKKTNCEFVHQNMSDVSAHEKNIRDRKKFLEQLDEMTRIAANMEKKDSIKMFSDVINYDFEKANWYIPGLWLGIPPMASVSYGYSESVSELKLHLFKLIKANNSQKKPLNIDEFIKWMSCLWNAVKHEKFLFSFRNSLVVEAYNKLAIQFSQWEWGFNKAVKNRVIYIETEIKNHSADSFHPNLFNLIRGDIQEFINNEEKKMLGLLDSYFEDKSENVNLIERYKHDFYMSIKSLKGSLERNAILRCDQALRSQKMKFEFHYKQKLFLEKMERDISEFYRRKLHLRSEELQNQFDFLWEYCLTRFQIKPITREEQNIYPDVAKQFYDNVKRRNPGIEPIQDSLLKEWEEKTNDITKGSVDASWMASVNNDESINIELGRIKQLSISLINQCKDYVKEKENTKSYYRQSYCQDLLEFIDERLQDAHKDHNIPFSISFEENLKLLVLGQASQRFQEMHHSFFEENDPYSCLEKLKSQYFVSFSTYHQTSDQTHQKAREFCNACLKPALIKYIHEHLKSSIMDDVLNGSDNMIYNSRSLFHAAVLERLMDGDVENYFIYITQNRLFLKKQIEQDLINKYKKAEHLYRLEESILTPIVKKMEQFLANEKCRKSSDVKNLLQKIQEEFKCELIIEPNKMKAITLCQGINVSLFSDTLQSMLSETKQTILSEMKTKYKSILKEVIPRDELLKKVMGCSKRCPFCLVPCEAAGFGHTEHFASIHRPEGLSGCKMEGTQVLRIEICSTSVVSRGSFKNPETNGRFYPYKSYKQFYPDWCIQPDASIESSDYWKYVFVNYNQQFTQHYSAKLTKLPKGWSQITKEQALRSLKTAYNKK